jgi:hypothetical protein
MPPATSGESFGRSGPILKLRLAAKTSSFRTGPPWSRVVDVRSWPDVSDCDVTSAKPPAVGTPGIGEIMSTDQVHLERRASQRFDFQLPVGVRLAGTDREGCGFTQDLSGRGAFFYTDFQVAHGDAVELTFMMPAEITLTENMRVRCRGRVTRVMPGYEYLSEAESTAQVSASFPRVSGAHDANQTRKNSTAPSAPTVAVEG